MATQRIASASIRGAAKVKNNLTATNAALVQQERWKSTPAIGIDSSSTSGIRGQYFSYFRI